MAILTSTLISIAFQVAALIYSTQRQRALAKKMAAMQDAQKGFELNTEGDTAVVPVVYGRNLIGGHRVWIKAKSDYSHMDSSDANFDSFNNGLTASVSGAKNEFLFLQQVLSHGEIHKVYDVLIQGDRVYNNADFNPGLRVNIHKAGSYADELIANNFAERATATFHKLAYASAVFKLNRDDPQYQGIPDLQYLIEGIKVRAVQRQGSTGAFTYTLATNRVYSNNPALCILDYLLSAEYGKGLSIAEIDLESFYNAAQICGTIVQTGVTAEGKIWKPTNGSRNVTSRDLPLYECNLTLDPEQPIRDNLEVLLETMNGAELVWSGGVYKLLLQYPINNQAINVAGDITDDDIIRDNVSIVWPSASERLNFATVKYKNESLDFKEDTVSWPPKTGSVYLAYKTQDNNIPLERESFDTGIKDYYHALAKAEEQVRRSRESASYQLKVNVSNSLYEPGDIIRINSSILKLTNEYIQLSEVKLNTDNTVNLSGFRFVPEVFAWNAKDDEIVRVPSTFNFSINPPTNIAFISGYEDSLTYSVGTLTWDPPANESPDSYIIEKFQNGNYIYLGTAAGPSFELYNLKAGAHIFAVRSRSNLGRLSTRQISSAILIDDGTSVLPLINVSDDITAFAGQIDSRLNVDFINQEPIFFGGYEVDARKQGTSIWKNIGSGKSTRFTLNGVEDGSVYEIRARIINALGAYSNYTTTQHLVIGKTAPPSSVNSFTSIQRVNGINLKWSAIPDPDVSAYIIKQGTNWDTGQVIVKTKDLEYIVPPIPTGDYTWLIKAVDTSSNESIDAKSTQLSVTGPTGIQTPSTELVDGLLTLKWDTPTSAYPITDYIIRTNNEIIAEIKSTRYSVQVNWAGEKVFYVSTRDASGQEGPQIAIPFTVNLPPKPLNFKTTVIDNNILFNWTGVRGTLPTREYILKKGNSLDTAIDIGTTRGLFSTYLETKAGLYTYWIAAVDIAGQVGLYEQVTSKVSAPPDYELAVDYYSDFSSASRLNMAAVNGEYLLPVSSSQTWSQHFDNASKTTLQEFISGGYSLFIQPGINTGAIDAYYEETYALGTPLTSMSARIDLTGEVLSGNPVIKTYLSSSEDGVNFTEYVETSQLFLSSFSYVRFKIVVDSPDDKSVYLLKQINIVLDAKLKSDTGTTTCLDTDVGGTTVYFNQDFIDVTTIGLTVKGTTPSIAVYDFDGSLPNPTSFKILLFDTNGVRTSGSVTWTAKGY